MAIFPELRLPLLMLLVLRLSMPLKKDWCRLPEFLSRSFVRLKKVVSKAMLEPMVALILTLVTA